MSEEASSYNPSKEQSKVYDQIAQEVLTEFIPLFYDAAHRDNSSRLCPEAEYAAIQEGLAGINPDDAEKVSAFVTRYRNSELGKKVKEIQSIEFLDEQADQIRAINDNLKSPEFSGVMDSISSALAELNKRRILLLGTTNEELVKASLEHIDQVVEASQAVADGNPDPLTKIFAYIHDISKVDANKPEVGLHEAGSASLSKSIVKSVFAADSVKRSLMDSLGIVDPSVYDTYIEQVGRCAEVAVASHGKGEFPNQKSKASPIDAEEGLYKLFGFQLYVDAYVDPAKYGKNLSQSNQEALARLIGGVQEADMVTGITLDSMKKYHVMGGPDLFYKHPPNEGGHVRASSLDYQCSLAWTYFAYLKEMPDQLGIRRSKATEIQQTALIFALAAKAEGLDTQDQTVAALNDRFRDHLGEDVYDSLLRPALLMKKAFQDGSNEKDEHTRKDIYDAHRAAFGLVVNRIKEKFTSPILDEDFNKLHATFTYDTLPTLSNAYNTKP
jgi:hypothetical protein